MKRDFTKLFTGLLALECLVALLLAIAISWISTDAPFYLGIARDLSEGKVMYREILNPYTPLVSYLFSGIFRLIDHPSYTWFLLTQLVCIVAGALMLSKILERKGVSKLIIYITILAYTITILGTDGNYINLEVFGIIFILAALYGLEANWSFICIGMLLGASFLCKQYGVLNFTPFYAYILLNENSWKIRIKQGVMLSAGGLLILLIFTGFYLAQGVTLESLFGQISGMQYAGFSIERERSIISILIGAKNFILVLIIPVIILFLNKKVNKQTTFLFLGIAVNLLPIFLQSFQHYYINTFPYVFILTAVAFQRAYDNQTLTKNLAIYFVCISVIFGLFALRIVRYRNEGPAQQKLAGQLEQVLPKDSNVFIEGKLRFLYVTNNYKNPLVDSIGYSFTFSGTEKLVEGDPGFNIVSSKDYADPSEKKQQLSTPQGAVFIYQ